MNEKGFAVCRLPDGSLVRGPVAEGTEDRIKIPASCPAGGVLVGSVHTHPGGPLTPSRRDRQTAREFGLEFFCITDEHWQQVRCYGPSES